MNERVSWNPPRDSLACETALIFATENGGEKGPEQVLPSGLRPS